MQFEGAAPIVPGERLVDLARLGVAAVQGETGGRQSVSQEDRHLLDRLDGGESNHLRGALPSRLAHDQARRNRQLTGDNSWPFFGRDSGHAARRTLRHRRRRRWRARPAVASATGTARGQCHGQGHQDSGGAAQLRSRRHLHSASDRHVFLGLVRPGRPVGVSAHRGGMSEHTQCAGRRHRAGSRSNRCARQ